MKIHVYPFSEQPVSKWSGGSTRELAIYPFDSELAKRNFIFRISTATVEAETSSFSKFNGFQRSLMILNGELKIQHKDHYTKKLGAFDIDLFDGSWETTAEGKVVDFNVIYSDKVKQVEVRQVELNKGQSQTIELIDFTGIYMLKGSIKISDKQFLEKDFALIEQEVGSGKIKLEVNDDSEYILVSIKILRNKS